ncbi:hypothetical protein MASR2M17_17840 [Aminivibrio sp.]
MRYHFALLALRSGLPVTLAAYDPKVESMGREWSLPSWKGEGELPLRLRLTGGVPCCKESVF